NRYESDAHVTRRGALDREAAVIVRNRLSEAAAVPFDFDAHMAATQRRRRRIAQRRATGVEGQRGIVELDDHALRGAIARSPVVAEQTLRGVPRSVRDALVRRRRVAAHVVFARDLLAQRCRAAPSGAARARREDDQSKAQSDRVTGSRSHDPAEYHAWRAPR